jgi:hypothetical protein
MANTNIDYFLYSETIVYNGLQRINDLKSISYIKIF